MASTPSQNNAFELMTTGEKSGQWGDITNTNMEIIDRATKGVGAITLTGTGDEITTIDYTASNGHYAVLVLSGTAGTVTINPNDQQKVFIIKNTTAGTVTITQGSGGNVTISAGKSAIIYADGAGAGAEVVDVTATLNGLAIGTDVLAYDSNLQAFVNTFTLPTLDSTNGYVLSTNGSGTLQFSPTGSGDGSVTSVEVSGGTTGLTTSGGPITTAGTITIDGTLNVDSGGTGSATASGARTNLGLAIGTDVLAFDSNLQSFVTTFTLPTSDGTSEQFLQTNGSGTLSFAAPSIDSLSDARTTANDDLFLGDGAGAGVSGGSSGLNIAIGADALNAGTSSSRAIIAVGANAAATSGGAYSIYIGDQAGRYADGSSTLYNTFVGYRSGRGTSVVSTGGGNNTGVGGENMLSFTSGSNNALLGFYAGKALSSGSDNVHLGAYAGQATSTGTNQVVVGYNAAASSATVSNEITIGNTDHNVVRFPGTTTVSGLPSASTVGAGARSFVTDATATTFASIVAGGGSTGVPVYSDGTNWRIG